MVFIKFYNMNREKKCPNVAFKPKQLKKFHFITSQNNITITVQKCSVFFSSFFNLCTAYFTKNVCSFFLSFFYMLCSTMFKFLFYLFFFFFFHFHCPVGFGFGFHFFFFFFIINCSFNVPFFFQPYIYLSLSLL